MEELTMEDAIKQADAHAARMNAVKLDDPETMPEDEEDEEEEDEDLAG